MKPTEHETTKTEIERVCDKYVESNAYRIEALLRTAFLSGYSEGLDAASRIYNPQPE